MYDIKCTVKSIKGECPAGLKVGDHFYQKDMGWIQPGEPDGICLHALVALAPYLTAKCRQAAPDDWIHEVDELQCPDSKNSVVFRLERMKDE